MALEIERKFLCSLSYDDAHSLAFDARHIRSIYLENTPKGSFRVVRDILSDGPINIELYQTITVDILIWWVEKYKPSFKDFDFYSLNKSYGKWYENFIDRALDEIYPNVSDLTENQFNQAFEYQLIKLKEEILDRGYLYYNFDWW